MPGSPTLALFSVGLLRLAIWEVSERQALQQAEPHILLNTAASLADFREQDYRQTVQQADPHILVNTVASLADFSEQDYRQAVQHADPHILLNTAASLADFREPAGGLDRDADGFGEPTTANSTSCADELFGVETEEQHALSSERSSEANLVSMRRSAVFASFTFWGVAAAEALVGIGLLLKYLQHNRACPYPENLPSPTTGSEEQESRPGPCAPEGGVMELASHRTIAQGQPVAQATVEIQQEEAQVSQRQAHLIVEEQQMRSEIQRAEQEAQEKVATEEQAARESLARTQALAAAQLAQQQRAADEAANRQQSDLAMQVKRLTAENNALKGAVHSVWRGDAIDIWDFEDQIATHRSAASDSSAESSAMSVSSTFDGHSSCRQSSTAFEAFSIGSRESSSAGSREHSDNDAVSSQHLTSSDDDAASSCHPASSDDDAASSHCPASTDDDDDEDDVAGSQYLSIHDKAASSHPVANMDHGAPSFHFPTPSHQDADLTDLDVEEDRSICFPRPSPRCGGVHRFAARYTPSSTTSDVEDEMNLPRFSAPYTPSNTSSDEAEEAKSVGRNAMDSEAESIQSQAQIQLTGPFTKMKHCFSSPYASSVSGSSETCDEDYQQDSDDDKRSRPIIIDMMTDQHRQVQKAWQNAKSLANESTRKSPGMAITPIQEPSEHKYGEFVRDPWRLVDGILMQRHIPTPTAAAKNRNGKRDLMSMMLSLW